MIAAALKVGRCGCLIALHACLYVVMIRQSFVYIGQPDKWYKRVRNYANLTHPQSPDVTLHSSITRALAEQPISDNLLKLQGRPARGLSWLNPARGFTAACICFSHIPR